MSTVTFIYALLIGLLPPFIWLFFWTKEDRLHPEPRAILAACFLGGSLAVTFAVLAEKYTATIITDENTRYAIWAAIEEVIKFLVVAVVALRTSSNDEPIDAMIYCITLALGFAALENMFFVVGPLSDGHFTTSILTGNMRFMGATLVHTVSSALVGFCLSLTFYKSLWVKCLAAIIGLILASTLHTGFNLSIMNASGADILRIFSWVWASVIILIILFEEVKAVRPKLT